MTLYETLNLLEESDDLPTNTIWAIPPPPNDKSDECSGSEEDKTEPKDLNRLPGRQLREKEELGTSSNIEECLGNTLYASYSSDENKATAEDSDSSTAADKRAFTIFTRPLRSRMQAVFHERWKTMRTGTLSSSHSIFPESNSSEYRNFSPPELFSLFFDDDVIEMIVHQSALYAQTKSSFALELSKTKLKVFLSML